MSKKVKKISIHTTISESTYELIEKFTNMMGAKNKKIFRNKAAVIEEALKLLDQKLNPEKNDLQEIWNKSRNELNLVTVGKPTYLAYISGDHKKALHQNIAVEVIEWYKRKEIDELSVKEILESIKVMWMAGNYFYKVDIEVGSKGLFHVTFYHDFHSEKYSEFWGAYFSELLKTQRNCEVEKFVRIDSFILTVSPEN
ncbi:MAG: hypothetical protein HWN65_10845 [Candidatus Helarchaeota archaeon]|nr:hypothetical protein [Candidatus Helarchaeota archaeon]